jgi:hypothetical protein
MPSTKSHGRHSVLKIETAAYGGAQDLATGFMDTIKLDRKTDRVVVPTFGDVAERIIKGLRKGNIPVSGYWMPSASVKTHGRQARVLLDSVALTPAAADRGFFQGKIGRKVVMPAVPVAGDTDDKYDVLGLGQGSVSLSGYFDGTVAGLDSTIGAALDWDPNSVALGPILSLAPQGFAIGNLVEMLILGLANHVVDTGVNKAVDVSLTGQPDDQIDLGVSLHDLVAETLAAPQNYASVDESAATTGGGVGHLHVSAFNGTTATFKIQHSPDNAAWADLITFNPCTGLTRALGASQRIVLAAGTTVNRYVRCVLSAATYTSVTFSIVFGRRLFTYGAAGTHRHFAGLYGQELNYYAANNANPNPYAFEFAPQGTGLGNPKKTGSCRLESYDLDFGIGKATTVNGNFLVTGAVADGQY